jgi:hypothetical protein
MKNSVSLILFALAVILITDCKKDEPHLVTYPKSFPVVNNAQVAEATITYGDSISLTLSVSDKVTPLSTVEIQVVVNNDVVVTESIRTKGNQSDVTRKYGVPFIANRPNNADVKVYLSFINVDGWTTDTIINTTKAKRPAVNGIWLVTTSIGGSTYKLNLTDSVNLIYNIKGMNFGNSISYYLATKITKFKKVDWTGLVFGTAGNGIGLVTQTTGNPIISTDATLVGISELTFDALLFTVTPAGKLLEPVTTLDINVDLPHLLVDTLPMHGGNVYFGEGTVVTFTGLTNLQNQLSPDWFEITGTNTAKFLGKTGLYKAYYYLSGSYLYIEPQPDAIFPQTLWITGTGWGRPSTPYSAPSTWNWNSPLEFLPCRLVSDGVYQITLFGQNVDKGGTSAGFGTFDFKFYNQVGWFNAAGVNSEIDASGYTFNPATPFFGRSDAGNVGNVNGGPTTFQGVYQFTLDMNLKTITVVKIN